jgi:hypothetical protein
LIGTLERQIERQEAPVAAEAEVELAEEMHDARLRWRDDRAGMAQSRRARVADVEARLAADEVLSEMTMELLTAHQRLRRFRQMRARS